MPLNTKDGGSGWILAPACNPAATITGQTGLQAVAESAMVTATRETVLAAAGVILLGLLATLALPAAPRTRRDDPVIDADTEPAIV